MSAHLCGICNCEPCECKLMEAGKIVTRRFRSIGLTMAESVRGSAEAIDVLADAGVFKIEVTPKMVKAAWIVARRFWPFRIEPAPPCKTCGHSDAFRVMETAVKVDEPLPGFKEAIEAALAARDT